MGELVDGRKNTLFTGAGCADMRQISSSSCTCRAMLANFTLGRLGLRLSTSLAGYIFASVFRWRNCGSEDKWLLMALKELVLEVEVEDWSPLVPVMFTPDCCILA